MKSVLFGVVLALCLAAGLLFGEVERSPLEVVAAILAGPEKGDAAIWVRVPRVLLAAGVGAALAISGGALQGITGNPLADPFLIGAASGASVGAGVAILLGLSGTLFLPLLAFVGAIGATALALSLARSGGRVGVGAFLLAGVVVGTFLAALMNLILFLAGQESSRVLGWLLGSLNEAEGWQAALVLALSLAGGIVLTRAGRSLDAFSFGEETARAVGVEVESFKRGTLALCALLTGAAVAFSGVIGFVGLVAPHLVRALIGPAHRRLIPLSGLLGASLLTLADLLSRVAHTDQGQLPIGVVTALLGAPFFFFLLRRQLTG